MPGSLQPIGPGDSPAGVGLRAAGSPVDEHTYDVLQALTSKLHAIEAYQVYVDDDETGLFEELLVDEWRHAERLVEELRTCLA